jgi:rod shape-determining protein MreD
VTIYLVVPLLVIVAVLQASVVSHLPIWGVFVDLPVLIVASWGLLEGAREGVIWGFIAGVVIDLLSGAPFGAATLSLMAVGFLAGLGKNSAFGSHVIFLAVTMLLATIVYSLLFLSIVRISGQTVLWWDSLLHIVLPSAVLNAVLMPLVFAVMRLVHRRVSQEEMEW